MWKYNFQIDFKTSTMKTFSTFHTLLILFPIVFGREIYFEDFNYAPVESELIDYG